MNGLDENSCFNELRHYIQCYFDYRIKSNDKTLTPYTREYLQDFVNYCKENAYYYAQKLLELKEKKENDRFWRNEKKVKLYKRRI